MATHQNLRTFTVPASGDLSTKQFFIMTLDADGKALLTDNADDTTEPPMTVLMNKPNAEDEPAELACPGSVVKVMCGGTINETDAVTCDGNGAAVATVTAGDKCIGRMITAGASGKIGTVLLSMFMFEGS